VNQFTKLENRPISGCIRPGNSFSKYSGYGYTLQVRGNPSNSNQTLNGDIAMNRFHPVLIGAALSGLLLLPTAQADDDTGLYLGASANRMSANFRGENDVNFDESDTAGGLRIGYMVNNFFGVEFGYLDLGSYNAVGDTPSNNINLSAKGFTGAFILNWELVNQIDVYGKVGAFSIDTDANSTIAGIKFSESETSTEVFGGIGIELDLGNINFFAEYSAVNTDVNDLTLDIASIGIKYEFGN
jgi:OOP family OmpA-OmpF porin